MSRFDPDAYLAQNEEKAQGFDPDAYLTENQEPKQRSTLQNVGRNLGLGVRGVAKSALGGFGLADMFIDPIQAAAGMETTAQGRDKLLDMIGFPKTETPLEENIQTGIDVMTSIGGQAKAAQQLTKPITGLLQRPGTAKNVSLMIGDDVGQQLAAGVPAAMVADQIADVAIGMDADPYMTGIWALSTGLLVGIAGGSTYRRVTREKVPLFTPEMAREQARASYDKVKQAGVDIKGPTLTKAVDDIQARLIAEGGLIPELPAHQEIITRLKPIRLAAQTGKVSFSDLDTMRSDIVTTIRETNDPAQKRMLSMVLDGIDQKMGTLQPNDVIGSKGTQLGEAMSSVREAREAWRRGAKASILEDALEAGIRRGEAPTGREGEIIRKNFENLYANKKKMKLFSKEEQEAIKRVASGGKGFEQLLNYTARFNPQRGTLAMFGSLGAAAYDPFIGIPVAAGGIASDKLLQNMQRNAARNVMSQVASGKIPQPRSSQKWRALVEAETQALQAQIEQQYQESQIAP
jgi:hypothetical protein